jgi:hypothetical protein
MNMADFLTIKKRSHQNCMQRSLIFVLGNLNRKAPMVAEIAPEAPIEGTTAG